jgi:DNA-binding NtrC family response regulator
MGNDAARLDVLAAAPDALQDVEVVLDVFERGLSALNVIQRQLGHADLGVTSVYLQGIDNTEVISAVRSRQAPVMPASARLLL